MTFLPPTVRLPDAAYPSRPPRLSPSYRRVTTTFMSLWMKTAAL